MNTSTQGESVPLVRPTQTEAADGARLTLVRETASFPPIDCPHHASDLARHLLDGRDRETFITIHMDTKRRFVSAEIVAIGTLSATLIHPREVYKGALLANAAFLIIAHNHPSGDPTPSAGDLAVTEQLLRAGELVGIELTDHLIVGATVVSLRETTQLWR